MTLRTLGPHRFDRLVRLIRAFDREAEKCAKIRSYYAACVLEAAVLEGLLVAVCDAYMEKVESYLAQLPSRRRPQGQIWEWGLADLIRVAAELEWLPKRSGPRGRLKIGDLVGVVKELRNLVHPGRHVRQYPNLRLRSGHYQDAYEIVRAASARIDSHVVRRL